MALILSVNTKQMNFVLILNLLRSFSILRNISTMRTCVLWVEINITF